MNKSQKFIKEKLLPHMEKFIKILDDYAERTNSRKWHDNADTLRDLIDFIENSKEEWAE